MDETIFINNLSKESALAKKTLKENKITFVEVFSDTERFPSLIAKDCVFPYDGLNQISQYANSRKELYKDSLQ